MKKRGFLRLQIFTAGIQPALGRKQCELRGRCPCNRLLGVNNRSWLEGYHPRLIKHKIHWADVYLYATSKAHVPKCPAEASAGNRSHFSAAAVILSIRLRLCTQNWWSLHWKVTMTSTIMHGPTPFTHYFGCILLVPLSDSYFFIPLLIVTSH